MIISTPADLGTPNTAADVLNHIRNGADLIVPALNGEPHTVIDALEANADQLENVRIHQMDPTRERPYIRGAGRYWSGSGGQTDFARGAMYSQDGQAYLVTHSATHDNISRITVNLTAGSAVTTLKNTVDNVVTEYGIAELRGRSISQRAAALIAIAHPNHRDRLRHEAREAGLLH